MGLVAEFMVSASTDIIQLWLQFCDNGSGKNTEPTRGMLLHRTYGSSSVLRDVISVVTEFMVGLFDQTYGSSSTPAPS
jgi:hypothetical protein